MQEALNTIYYIFNKLVSFVFNDAAIESGVSIGWVITAVFVFGIIITSILNLPRSMGTFDRFREHTYVTNTTHSDGSKSWSERRTFRR